MTRSALFCLAAALPLLLSACPAERERPAFEELASTADTTEGYRTDAPAPVAPVPDTTVADLTATGSLAEVNRSGVSGGVTVTAQNGRTQVLLRVSGLQPGVTVTPTLHEGFCDVTPGRTVAQLDPITADGGGIGTGTATAAVAPEQVLDGRHSVRIYTGPSDAVPPVACANLPEVTISYPSPVRP